MMSLIVSTRRLRRGVALCGAVLGGAVCPLPLTPDASAADSTYLVSFRQIPVATQFVSRVEEDGLITIATRFAAAMPVFTAVHRYSEELTVTFRPGDGAVTQCRALRVDGGKRVEVEGNAGDDGSLVVYRRDNHGVVTNTYPAGSYDFHSLIHYALPPSDYLTTNSPARMLDIARGEVVPVEITGISEARTFERQVHTNMHLIWKSGHHTSESWHTERLGYLPDPFVRQTENGDFVFELQAPVQ